VLKIGFFVRKYRLQERKSNFAASFSSFNAVYLIAVCYGIYKVVPDCQGACVLWFVSRRSLSCALKLTAESVPYFLCPLAFQNASLLEPAVHEVSDEQTLSGFTAKVRVIVGLLHRGNVARCPVSCLRR
jgi:hypothetical protein